MNKKLIISALCFAYCVIYVFTTGSWHFFDGVNLVFHEAGHIVFSLFGDFIAVAGGTIMQLLIPVLIILYFEFKQKSFAASIILFWLALSFFNVAIYAGDALRQELPLLTNDKLDHDWNQMLFTLGWLRQTDLISNIFWAVGGISALGGLIWGYFASNHNEELLS